MSQCEAIERQRSEAEQRSRLLARIASGESLASITRDLSMPSRPQVCEWLWADADFAMAFRAARVRGTDLLAEECLEIADEPAPTAVEVADKRVRIDTRLKLMARWQRTADSDMAKAEPRPDPSQLTDEQLEVLASIPLVVPPGHDWTVPGALSTRPIGARGDEEEVMARKGAGECASPPTTSTAEQSAVEDVADHDRHVATEAALDAAIDDAPAVADPQPTQPRDTVAAQGHAAVGPGLAQHAPPRVPVAGRSMPGDRDKPPDG